ncbi:MAG: hypothetical protein ACO3JG_08730, partial [Luteolibacter sp.]
MTSTKYFIARIAQAFGYVRRPQRMANAASEMHLLREAEAYLGEAIWQKVENVEKLSVEYWNLRKLMKERMAVEEKLQNCQARLDKAHQERAELLNSMPEENEELFNQRVALLAELESLAVQRDKIVADAREVRRAYVGLKMKLEVLASESGGVSAGFEDAEKVKARLQKLKKRFAELKDERMRIGGLIEQGDNKLDKLDQFLKQERLKQREHASQAFQVIGEGNKEISILRAESGLLDTQMRQLFGEIGRYVSRHSHLDPSCA